MILVMDASRNSTEEAVREVIELHSVVGDLIPAVRYGAATITFVINAAIVIAFLAQKLRRPSVHVSPTGLLVLNLLLIDTLLGAVILYNLATSWTFIAAGSTWCEAQLTVTFLAVIGSHIALLNVVVDRFIAIVYSLKHRDVMTWGRSVAMVSFGWLIPAIGAVAVAVAVVVTHDPLTLVERCSDINASRVFLQFVWIPVHSSANLCVIVIQYRVYLYLKRHDQQKVTCNSRPNSSDRSAWILFRITTPTYLSMLLLDLMKIVLMLRSNPFTQDMYQLVLLFVQIAFLMNPLMFAYATGNIRRPVLELCDDIKKWLSRGKKPMTEMSVDNVQVVPVQMSPHSDCST